MKEKGILFSAPMVRAILDNRKTQTRRAVKLPDQPCVGKNGEGLVSFVPASDGQHFISQLRVEDSFRRVKTTLNGAIIKCPYPVGTRVYIKETHQRLCGTCYRATGHSKSCLENGARHDWIPSIFMPKRLARIWLEITGVRVERLQDITEEDAKAEGVTIQPSAGIASNVCKGNPGPAQFEYYALWESINGKGSWDLNPWVWTYTFRRIEK